MRQRNNIKTTRQRSKSKLIEIDFKKVVDDAVNSLNKQEGAYKLNINITIEGFIPFVTDQEMMQLVFTNIISNAIRFRHPHEVKPALDVHIELFPETALMRFKDNGIGIEAQYLNKVFEMFYCVPGQKTEGSGLGLFAVREAVRKLKGNIKVQSVKGTGTTFVAEIPNRIDPDLKRQLIKLIDNSK